MKMSQTGALALSLRLVVCYVLFCLAGTVLCAAAYTVYRLCTALVAGGAVTPVSVSLVLEGVLVMMPLVLGLSSMFMAFYLTRHPSGSTVPVVVLVLLSLVTWYAVLPPVLHASGKALSGRSSAPGAMALSPGLFRDEGQFVFWYSGVSSSGVASGLAFETSPDMQGVYTFSDVAQVERSSEFTDPLIGRTVAMPALLSYIISCYRGLLMGSLRVYGSGYVPWAFYASLGIALCSVAGLRGISRWRLLSMNAILYATLGILVLNYLFVATDVLSAPSAAVASWFRRVPFIQNPLQVLANVFVAVVFLVVGIVSAVRRKKRGEPAQGGYA